MVNGGQHDLEIVLVPTERPDAANLNAPTGSFQYEGPEILEVYGITERDVVDRPHAIFATDGLESKPNFLQPLLEPLLDACVLLIDSHRRLLPTRASLRRAIDHHISVGCPRRSLFSRHSRVGATAELTAWLMADRIL